MNFGGFGGGNLNQIMRQAQKMQEDMKNIRKEIDETEFSGTAGGGMVECVVLGTREIKSIKYNPNVVDKDDIEMLEDLTIASINDAMAKIKKMETEKLPNMGI